MAVVGGMTKIPITRRSIVCGSWRISDNCRAFKMENDKERKKQKKRMNWKNVNFSCTTFNILAPIYKRMSSETCRESQFKEYWWERNKQILDMLLKTTSSIICLQEFWVKNEELVDMYEDKLRNHGYDLYKLGRPNNRGDGLLTAVRKDHFRVLNYRELLLNGVGDRVAQLLHVQSITPFWQSQGRDIRQETLVVNTHLMFPHNSDICLVRLRQVYKILEYLESYKSECKLHSIPIILCGDWNGSKRGHVYKFLRSQGFVSSYDSVHHYTDSDADAHKWVSHRNHRGNICGVDFIWLLNPNTYCKSLKTSWNEAVFGIIKSKLREAGLKDRDAFCFFKSEDSCNDHVKKSEFYEAMRQLRLRGKHSNGLSTKEIEDLWAAVDTDRNGIIVYEEFERILSGFTTEQAVVPAVCRQSAAQGKWSSTHCSENIYRKLSLQKPCRTSTMVGPNGVLEEKVETESNASLKFEIYGNFPDLENLECGFDVKSAFLFPPEVERGMWPENYALSDHAPLTVVFSPVRLQGHTRHFSYPSL